MNYSKIKGFFSKLFITFADYFFGGTLRPKL